MYIYTLGEGGVFKSDKFYEDIDFLECIYVGVGTMKEFVGGEWAEVPFYSEEEK